MFIFVLLYSISSNAQSQDRVKAVELWDKAKGLYDKKEYEEAAKLFQASNRLFEDSKCMYYYAQCLNKTQLETCTSRITSWERYLDSCRDIGQTSVACGKSWIDKAQQFLDTIKANCKESAIIEEKNSPSVIEPTREVKIQTSSQNNTDKKKENKETFEENTSDLRMNASFFCKFKKENGYEERQSCNGETFKEGDRVSFAVTPLQNSYFYMLLFNESGQAQMLWPEKAEEDHLLLKDKTYTFPPEETYGGWWEVDNVKNVTEIILLILSKDKINSLDELRGKEMKYDDKLKSFIPNQKVDRGLVQITEELKKKNISIGIKEMIKGTSERVITKFEFKHE